MANSRGLRPVLDRLFAGGVADVSIALEQIALLVLLKLLSLSGKAEVWWHTPALDAVSGTTTWARLKSHDDPRALQRYAARDVPNALALSARTFGEPFMAAVRDVAFDFPTGDVLADAIRLIDEVLPDDDAAPYGAAYDDLLVSAELTGRRGQFVTPRPVIEAMVSTMSPRLDERVLDPAAGTGGFLVAARDYAASGRAGSVKAYGVGLDLDATMVRLGATNMLLHGEPRPQMHHWDGLREDLPEPTEVGEPAKRATVVLSNPPFAASVEDKSRTRWLDLDTPRAELLFLDVCRRRMGDNGRAAVVVPVSLLFGTSPAHTEVRSRLLREARVVGVAALPSDAFGPHVDVQSAVVVFDARGATERVWFTELQDQARVSQDLVTVRRALDSVAPLDAPTGWWSADAGEILDNSGVLLPAEYSEAARTPLEGDPRAILRDVLQIEDELRDRLARLEQTLGRR
jgi:type I restriction enzyme M protein